MSHMSRMYYFLSDFGVVVFGFGVVVFGFDVEALVDGLRVLWLSLPLVTVLLLLTIRNIQVRLNICQITGKN